MPTITVIKPTKKEITTPAVCDSARKKRVAGYARVSTDKDEQFTSYEAQVEYYTNYIKHNDEWEFVGVYTDEGISGTGIKHRTGFRRMVSDALDGKIDLIITKSISRFARNTVDSLQTIRVLKEHNVELYFEKENIRTFDGKGELLITIMSSLAQEESRSISENVTWGIRECMKKGKAWVPFAVFLGYDKGESGEWVIVPEQAMLVRRIFGMYLQGLSPYHICKFFEKQGTEFSKGKYKWHASTVASILKNEKYKGDALRQKTYTVNYLTKEKVKNDGVLEQYYIRQHHEPIISSELFDKVQEEIERRGMTGERRIGNRIFSMRVKCGCCGGWFGACTWAYGTSRERIVWRCIHKYAKGKLKCKPPAVSEELLRKTFVETVNKLLVDNGIMDVFERVREDDFKTVGYLSERNELESELAYVGEMMKNTEFVNDEYYRKRFELASARMAELDGIIAEIKNAESEAKSYLRLVCDVGHISEFDEKLFLLITDYMTVYDKEKITVTFRNDITF